MQPRSPSRAWSTTRSSGRDGDVPSQRPIVGGGSCSAAVVPPGVAPARLAQRRRAIPRPHPADRPIRGGRPQRRGAHLLRPSRRSLGQPVTSTTVSRSGIVGTDAPRGAARRPYAADVAELHGSRDHARSAMTPSQRAHRHGGEEPLLFWSPEGRPIRWPNWPFRQGQSRQTQLRRWRQTQTHLVVEVQPRPHQASTFPIAAAPAKEAAMGPATPVHGDLDLAVAARSGKARPIASGS
jgi:hypothetical protein